MPTKFTTVCFLHQKLVHFLRNSSTPMAWEVWILMTKDAIEIEVWSLQNYTSSLFIICRKTPIFDILCYHHLKVWVSSLLGGNLTILWKTINRVRSFKLSYSCIIRWIMGQSIGVCVSPCQPDVRFPDPSLALSSPSELT